MRSVGRWMLVALVYTTVDTLLNRYTLGVGWTILWPINGVTIAVMLRLPRRRWPWFLSAAALGLSIGEKMDGNPALMELGLRSCSVVEVVISAWCLPRFVSMGQWLAERRIVGRISLALLLGPGISGLFATWVYLQFDWHHRTFCETLNGWSTSDMLGIAVTLPLALAVTAPEMRQMFSRREASRTVFVLLVSILVAVGVFAVSVYPLLFLLYPMLLYVDTRRSFAGTSISILLSALIGVCCTVHGLGPFGHWSTLLPISRDGALQLYLGFHALASLPHSLTILERKKMSAQLQEANVRLTTLSQQDALTGIANRRAFDERFAESWSRAAEQKTCLAMLMIDIDKFKQYNDIYGHLRGDRCLAEVAEALARVVHGPNALAARFGGEEFVVMLSNLATAECHKVAERLRQAVVAINIPHEGNSWGLVTISVGCASGIPQPGGERLELLERADTALYHAKQMGRNRWESAENGLNTGFQGLWLLQHSIG